jgi:hypothetical protein
VVWRLAAVGLAAALVAITPLAVGVHGEEDEPKERAAIEECFEKSLHATGAGMRFWYEQPDGFFSVTGVPYEDPRLGCTNCHANDCAACHGPGETISPAKAREPETCLGCHNRQVEERQILTERGITDVHVDAGMECLDCHSIEEMHGDCRAATSMHEPENPSPACTDCHEGEVLDSVPHTVHLGKLACAACHVENTLACLNCHIDAVIRDQSSVGNYLPLCDWTLLVNHEEQVTTGTAMTLVYGGEKFIAYAPYYTHAIQPQGRDCSECHAETGVRRVRSEEPLPMAKFWQDRLMPFLGVVPLKPDMLIWPYLEREGDIWMHSTNPDTARRQLVGYCTPLEPEQIRNLSIRQRR